MLSLISALNVRLVSPHTEQGPGAFNLVVPHCEQLQPVTIFMMILAFNPLIITQEPVDLRNKIGGAPRARIIRRVSIAPYDVSRFPDQHCPVLLSRLLNEASSDNVRSQI